MGYNSLFYSAFEIKYEISFTYPLYKTKNNINPINWYALVHLLYTIYLRAYQYYK